MLMCWYVSLLSFTDCDLCFNFRFLDAYRSHGLNFWALTPHNEPLCGLLYNCPYNNSMSMSPAQERDWVVNHLGPTLHANGYGDLEMMIVDDQRTFLPLWLCTVSLKSIILTSL
jgi:glucosylceramidase